METKKDSDTSVNAYVHVRIDKEMLKIFKMIALKRGTTVSNLVRRFIASVIRQEEQERV